MVVVDLEVAVVVASYFPVIELPVRVPVVPDVREALPLLSVSAPSALLEELEVVICVAVVSVMLVKSARIWLPVSVVVPVLVEVVEAVADWL